MPDRGVAMKKLLLLIILVGSSGSWRDFQHAIAKDVSQYKLEYSGTIGDPFQQQKHPHSTKAQKSLPKNKIAKTLPPKANQALVSAGITFPQGSFSIRVVRDKVASRKQKSQTVKTALDATKSSSTPKAD
jgi:hypothetical protein